MNQTRILGIAAFAAFAVNAMATSAAHAHINLDGLLKGDNRGNQKAAPCEGLARSALPQFTFEPGATIKVQIDETVKHPSYYRVAFDNDGADGFKDPASIDPIDPKRYPEGKCSPASAGRGKDNCGKSDFCNVVSTTGGPTVLWDNLDPHLAPESTKLYSWNIKLPNIECDNCTLQVIQVMEDDAFGFHGVFDGKNDLYYRCIAIKLKKGVGNTPGTVTTPTTKPNNGIECAKTASTADAGAAITPGSSVDAGPAPVRASIDGADDSELGEFDGVDAEASAGGCSLGSTDGARASSALGLLLALGALVARRRKPRA